MIGDQQERPLMREAIQMLEPIHVHQPVCSNLNPTGANRPLAPCPEQLPSALVHSMRNAEREAFHAIEYGEFFRRGIDVLVSGVLGLWSLAPDKFSSEVDEV